MSDIYLVLLKNTLNKVCFISVNFEIEAKRKEFKDSKKQDTSPFRFYHTHSVPVVVVPGLISVLMKLKPNHVICT